MHQRDINDGNSSSGASSPLCTSAKNVEGHIFHDVRANIRFEGQVVGYIKAIRIEREHVRDGYFLSTMADHSEILLFIGSLLYEPIRGRSKLKSLVSHDANRRSILYIDSLHLNSNLVRDKSKLSDIGTAALKQFLNQETLKHVASAVYVIDPYEAYVRGHRHDDSPMLDERKFKWDGNITDLHHIQNSFPFLRNGFFHELPLLRQCHLADLILVATPEQWSSDDHLSHNHAVQIMEDVIRQRKKVPPMLEQDEARRSIILNEISTIPTNENHIGTYRLPALTQLVEAGGSIEESFALHLACEQNCPQFVFSILYQHPDAINKPDTNGFTPLMVAAVNAVCRKGEDGITESLVIDILLSKGADKDRKDPDGLTAYGHFRRAMRKYQLCLNAAYGRHCEFNITHPMDQTIEQKLLPLNGPTDNDQAFGEAEFLGYVRYSD